MVLMTLLASLTLLLSVASAVARARPIQDFAGQLDAADGRGVSQTSDGGVRASAVPSWVHRRHLNAVGTATAIAEAYGPTTYTDTTTDVTVKDDKVKVKATSESYAEGDGWHTKAKAKEKAKCKGEGCSADVFVYTSASETGTVQYTESTVSPGK